MADKLYTFCIVVCFAIGLTLTTVAAVMTIQGLNSDNHNVVCVVSE